MLGGLLADDLSLARRSGGRRLVFFRTRCHPVPRRRPIALCGSMGTRQCMLRKAAHPSGRDRRHVAAIAAGQAFWQSSIGKWLNSALLGEISSLTGCMQVKTLRRRGTRGRVRGRRGTGMGRVREGRLRRIRLRRLGLNAQPASSFYSVGGHLSSQGCRARCHGARSDLLFGIPDQANYWRAPKGRWLQFVPRRSGGVCLG